MRPKNRTHSSVEGGDLSTPAPKERCWIWAAKKMQDGGEVFQVKGTARAETMRPVKVWGMWGMENTQWGQSLAREEPGTRGHEEKVSVNH